MFPGNSALKNRLPQMSATGKVLRTLPDYLIRYAQPIVIVLLAVVCAEFGIRLIHVPMKGIEHDPSLRDIALHMFSHVHGRHFFGNFTGMFFYAAMFSLAARYVDMRRTNGLFFATLILTVLACTCLALYVWPNDNGVAGISGVVNFLLGYFWTGCVPIFLFWLARTETALTHIQADRFVERYPSLLPIGCLLIIYGLHWLADGLDDLTPYGENALGKLYHLVGLSIGSLSGVFTALWWFAEKSTPGQVQSRATSG